METRRKSFEPTSIAQYYESVSDCLSFNAAAERQRNYDRKRRALVQTIGYEAVLNRAKRTQLSYTSYASPSTSSATQPSSMSTLKPAPSPGIKMPQTYNMDPKQLAAKYKPNVPATLKPMLPSETTTDAKLPFAIGTEVVIKAVDKLAAYGLSQLTGKKGKIISAPTAKGQFLYGVMFDNNTLQHVPVEALALASQAGQMQLPAASQLKIEHSFHMHRLMQDQFKEIQALQKQHAEYRQANNTAAMAEVQKSLSVLRNLHLSQIRSLKTKQEDELRQKEIA
ncbi:hypothetical protein, variant [Saprolegnia diclina VS20]|uniref:Uncharacterized protein n=1 Tax=Saprolegnia diclina (strain VS20) TaxID=1156394 RepID=T0RTT5_SAPDV|nr:hypothetical protein, variant [Saprolegnia diclina VS20]EQC35938.1 hypothetical protein, variant [Saprolegnia diclina VS20]|eukprot:XP_008610700.1 hypothetical protein, variant [Saprolegnia diclina VS20]